MEGRPAGASQRATGSLFARGPEARSLDGQLAIVGGLLLLGGGAWVASDLLMAGMDGGPGTDPGALGSFLGTWVVMMAAMMLPSISPVVLALGNLKRMGPERTADGPGAVEVGLFVGGYLLTWAAAGLLGYMALRAGRAFDGGLLAWHRSGRWAVAGVLVLAALYELAPHKRACLDRCRSPHRLLASGWRDGPDGALVMGMEHGAWCLGCCWALMAALFALGAMSLIWMLVISALIAAEKLLPWRAIASTGAMVALTALAIGVAVAPAQVPALTIPGSMAAQRAMGMGPSTQTPMPQGDADGAARAPDGKPGAPLGRASQAATRGAT